MNTNLKSALRNGAWIWKTKKERIRKQLLQMLLKFFHLHLVMDSLAFPHTTGVLHTQLTLFQQAMLTNIWITVQIPRLYVGVVLQNALLYGLEQINEH